MVLRIPLIFRLFCVDSFWGLPSAGLRVATLRGALFALLAEHGTAQAGWPYGLSR
ncbi:MAG: hypothetical protein AAGJ82_03220 [Bacteroidota bacterium]